MPFLISFIAGLIVSFWTNVIVFFIAIKVGCTMDDNIMKLMTVFFCVLTIIYGTIVDLFVKQKN